jgi:hypothetical protein
MIPTRHRAPGPGPIWTYAYAIVPAQAGHRLATIRRMLEHEHSDALAAERTWVSRVVRETRITHILIVSDDPATDRQINADIEAELAHLHVGFSLTAAMPVLDVPERIPVRKN